MHGLLLAACTVVLLIPASLAALVNCEIELCSSVDYTGYCKKWVTTINASPRGEYRVVSELPGILAGNVNSFRYTCEPDPYDQRLALWRNIFIRMFTERNYTNANKNLQFRKYYYQTGGFPRFVYRNFHPDLTAENAAFEPYYEFAIYYNVHGSFKPALIPPNNPIFPVADYNYDYGNYEYTGPLDDDSLDNETSPGPVTSKDGGDDEGGNDAGGDDKGGKVDI